VPTSGSRGCTATVVELGFNSDLLKKSEADDVNQVPVPVYKGEVFFLKLDEWLKELQVLVDECSTQEKTIYARVPDDAAQPAAAAAWQKINQVYGQGTLERYHGEPSTRVLNRLSNDRRVTNLLTPKQGSENPYNSIVVQEGEVEPGSAYAKSLLSSFRQMSTRVRGSKKRWAHKFRSKINGYVYRNGNGREPQTWPLIRKVVLQGPWPVLSTGACLVDLPGIRDANAARAKVAEQYLQHTNQIWVVAPIKRAVDDGTAKELLGEQFKRRLLMDGQYGNVSFICTQSDDCEATETIRDHQDVAMKKPGRWEKMNELLDTIATLEKNRNDLLQEEEDLKAELEDADQFVRQAKEELQEANKETELYDSDSEIEVEIDMNRLMELQSLVKTARTASRAALVSLKDWRENNHAQMEKMEEQSRKQQRRLKAICATVRNEYSKGCLQEDFKTGLKDLYRKDDEDDGGDAPAPATALPEDFEMDVFAISANDYLKIQGIKPKSDGPPNCFASPEETQIPDLRSFVHETTARYCTSFAKTFVNNAGDFLDEVKLLAADASNTPSVRSARKYKGLFESEMSTLEKKIKPIVDEFRSKAQLKVDLSLQPSLNAGASKGNAAAMQTVVSWGSSSRRTKQDRGPEKNGLYWSTYQATVRRDGVYGSASAGAVDFNQELCDPMEKEFSADWQRTMDSTFRTLLAECEKMLLAACAGVNKDIASGFSQVGMDSARLALLTNTASRSCSTALIAAFQSMRTVASDQQRELNRSILPVVQQRMKVGYGAAVSVARGGGVFSRMKGAIEGNSRVSVSSMFDESTAHLLDGIGNLIKQLANMVSSTLQVISTTLERVFRICWEDQADKSTLVDPVMQQKVRECRDRLLPDLNKLCQIQDDARNLVGIEREDLELDVMGVENFEQTLARKLEDAKKSGDAFDLCNSDEETDNRKPPARVNVKPEPGTLGTLRAASIGNGVIIDLCDSEDDSALFNTVTLKRSGTSHARRFKSEMN
jgi:hypothetical protein